MFVAPLVSSSQFTAKIPAIKAKQRQTVLLKSNIQPWNEPDTHTKTGRRFTMGNMPPAHTATRPHWVCGLSSEHWEGELLYFCRCYMRKQKKKKVWIQTLRRWFFHKPVSLSGCAARSRPAGSPPLCRRECFQGRCVAPRLHHNPDLQAHWDYP